MIKESDVDVSKIKQNYFHKNGPLDPFIILSFLAFEAVDFSKFQFVHEIYLFNKFHRAFLVGSVIVFISWDLVS